VDPPTPPVTNPWPAGCDVVAVPGVEDAPVSGDVGGQRPVTVVTGGGRGIGAATAVHLARAGHDLALGYLSDAASAEEVAATACAAGARVLTVAGDVADPAVVERLFAAAGELGPVRGLVNNAGLTAHIGDLADTSIEVIARVVEVNLLGAIWCARRAAQVMSTARGGVGGAIVNVSSGAATLGSAHEYVHYAAAKAGVDALTVGLAKELAGQGVRVNAVAPGMVATDIHAAAGDPDRLTRVLPRIPMGRAGQPGEIAPAITWLLGPDASYVTGAVLRVAGGL
jgi:NAD(P)-dependent dehydrogenase (short-subunit alcohol dehydrogenase family)